MPQVKTYHTVDRSNEKVMFGASKMEDVFLRRNGEIDEPHRHDFYTVLLIERGKGSHRIDFNTYELGEYQLFFVAPGQVHQLIEEEATVGYAMTFSTQFLVVNSIPLSFINSLNLFHDYGQSPPLKPNHDQFLKLQHFCSEILNLFQGSQKMKELSIGSFLKLFLIECNNLCSLHPDELNSHVSENRIIHDFKEQVNQAYKKEHSTSYYAGQLHISSDHLNRIIKTAIGKTAKEYIQSRIVTEAKRLLYFSNLSNKEIGYELGFNEPAHFSAFFKKCTGDSPSNFSKKELKA